MSNKQAKIEYYLANDGQDYVSETDTTVNIKRPEGLLTVKVDTDLQSHPVHMYQKNRHLAIAAGCRRFNTLGEARVHYNAVADTLDRSMNLSTGQSRRLIRANHMISTVLPRIERRAKRLGWKVEC